MKKIADNNVFAAIDLGSNSFRMLIVRYDKHKNDFTVVSKHRVPIRLGVDSSNMRHVSKRLIEEGINILSTFKKIALNNHAQIRAVATSTIRDAINKDEFIKCVKKRTGISIEVISGFEEARLIYLGVLRALNVYGKKVLLFDIGGGSTEFLVGYRGNVLYSNSIKLGAVRTTMQFFSGEEIKKKRIIKCRKYVAGMLIPIFREIKKYKIKFFVGTSGTITAIAKIILSMKGVQDLRTNYNQIVITSKDIKQVIDTITLCKTKKEIKKIPGVESQRADIILAGAIILEQIINLFDIDSISISEYSLKEGVIIDLIQKREFLQHHQLVGNIRKKSVMKLMHLFVVDCSHAKQVCSLALRLFDLTSSIHKLGYLEREYLEYAALLHDCGIFLSHSQHHLHSYYIIRNFEFLGFSEEEKDIIANVARYHRKSHPKKHHESFFKLNTRQKNIVRKLASILRIADGLDRSHAKLIKKIYLKKYKDYLIFKIIKKSHLSIEQELWSAERKKLLFEEVFHYNVKFKIIDD